MNVKNFTVYNALSGRLAELKQQMSQKMMSLLPHIAKTSLCCKSNIIFCDICRFSSVFKQLSVCNMAAFHYFKLLKNVQILNFPHGL